MALKPNLERARRRMSALMVDECVITRDALGENDDTLNETTLLLTSPAPVTIYVGKCMVSPSGIGREEGAEGRATLLEARRTYRGFIPLDAPEVLAHDTLTVTLSQRDPELAGRSLTVLGEEFSTFAISRRLDLEYVR